MSCSGCGRSDGGHPLYCPNYERAQALQHIHVNWQGAAISHLETVIGLLAVYAPNDKGIEPEIRGVMQMIVSRYPRR